MTSEHQTALRCLEPMGAVVGALWCTLCAVTIHLGLRGRRRSRARRNEASSACRPLEDLIENLIHER
jgi:hypothetical protein